MTKREKVRSKGMKINFWYLILVVLASVLTYIAQYLKFPNTWTIIFVLAFIVLILKNFNKKKGIDVLVYFLMWNVLTLPLILLFMSFISSPLNWVYMIVNMLVNFLMITGLMINKKWGLWLSVVVFDLSIFVILSSLFLIPTNYFNPITIYAILGFGKNFDIACFYDIICCLSYQSQKVFLIRFL